MSEPRSQEFSSPAEFRFALILSGKTEAEADRLVHAAWKRFQDQVRSADPLSYESEEAYLTALLHARLPTAEVDRLMSAARAQNAKQRERDEAERERIRRATERYERDLDREELGLELAWDVMARRYGLDSDDDYLVGAVAEQRLAEVRERYQPPPDPRFGPWSG